MTRSASGSARAKHYKTEYNYSPEEYDRVISLVGGILFRHGFRRLNDLDSWSWTGPHDLSIGFPGGSAYSGMPGVILTITPPVSPDVLHGGRKFFEVRVSTIVSDLVARRYSFRIRAKRLLASTPGYGFSDKAVTAANEAVKIKEYLKQLDRGTKI